MTGMLDVPASELAQALLDFGRAPGRHALRLGEPRVLHGRLDTVAQWAMGRLPEELAAALGAQARDVTAAAVLFIQRACFAPGNTHYQVFCLTPETLTPERLRTRYRALVRLTHPDMGMQGLPAHAVSMVNRAQEVLGDEPSRQHYDEQLRQTGAVPAAVGARHASAGRRHAGGWQRAAIVAEPGHLTERWVSLTARYPRQWRIGVVLGCVGVLAAAVLWWTAHDARESRVLVVARSGASPGAAPATSSPAPTHAADHAAAGPVAAAALAPQPAAVALPPSVQAERPASTQPGAASSAQPSHLANHAPALTAQATLAVARLGTPPAPAPERRANAVAPPAASPTSPSAPKRAMANPAVQLAQSSPAQSDAPEADARSRALPMRTEARETPAPTPPATVLPDALPTWSIDPRAARQYLDDIVATFDSVPRTRHLNGYLAGARVKGSLLRPVVDLQGSHPELHVQRTAWGESQQPGVLNLRSTVVLRPRTGAQIIYTYRLVAEFRGTRDGTVLDRLDVQPVQ